MGLRFVLENQFLQLDHYPAFFQVMSGSGMGLACSGEVSDAAFYFLAEKELLSNAEYLRSVGIVAYFRFKDGIVAFLDGVRRGPMKFFNDLSSRSGPFKLELERRSSSGATFLDVHVHKPRFFEDGGPLEFRVHVKPTSQWTPLSELSLHHPRVHAAWPRAMEMRFRRLCKRSVAADEFVSQFRAQMYQAGHRHANNLSATSPASTSPARYLSHSIPVLYLVLPFYSQWHRSSVASVVHNLKRVWAPRLGFRVAISWRLGDQHLVQRLKQGRASITMDALSHKIVYHLEDGRGR